MEVWKPIKGYEDFYEVSDHGRVRSKDRVVEYVLPTRVRVAVVKGRILKTGVSRDGSWGYSQVHLYGTEGRKARKCMRVHRLVAEAFIGPSPYPEAVVMHKDDNVTNNKATNLEWGTPKDNSMDMKLKNRVARGEDVSSSRLTDADIPKIRGYAKSGMTCYQIAKKFPVCTATIRFVVIGQTWKHVIGVEMP